MFLFGDILPTSDMFPVVIFMVAFIASIAILIIINIMKQKSYLNVDDEDFITKFINKKKKELNSSMGALSAKMYFTLLIILPIGVGILGWYFIDNKSMVIFMIIVSIFVPEIISRILIENQAKKFTERYGRSLRVLASGLRAGLTIQQAVEDVINNKSIHFALRRGFSQINMDIRVGVPISESFLRFAKDCENDDAYDVASAISMQSEVGGSEAKVIETIASNIQTRMMLKKEIKTLFAETNVLITVMDLIPIFIIIVLYFTAPDMIAPYFESVPMMILFWALIAVMLIGSIVVRKMLKNNKGGR